MPMKRIFNRNRQKEDPIDHELDKQILRINTLEVQIKKLLEFERQFRSSMLKKVKEDPTPKEDQQDTIKQLSRKIDRLEKLVQNSRNDSISLEKIEQLIVEKLATNQIKEQQMNEKINMLEELVSKLMIQEHSELIEKNSENSRQIEKETDQSDETDFIKQLNSLLQKHQNSSEQLGEPQDPIILYIDKLFLDKYEQNNNISQLGIKELSGALNIGATYGKDAIPKEIKEEAEEKIEKMKAATQKMKKSHHQKDEDHETYTDIEIENDQSDEESS